MTTEGIAALILLAFGILIALEFGLMQWRTRKKSEQEHVIHKELTRDDLRRIVPLFALLFIRPLKPGAKELPLEEKIKFVQGWLSVEGTRSQEEYCAGANVSPASLRAYMNDLLRLANNLKKEL